MHAISKRPLSVTVLAISMLAPLILPGTTYAEDMTSSVSNTVLVLV